MAKESKSEALKAKKEGKKHKHKYVKGKCACGHEENVEYGERGGGRETGREDED